MLNSSGGTGTREVGQHVVKQRVARTELGAGRRDALLARHQLRVANDVAGTAGKTDRRLRVGHAQVLQRNAIGHANSQGAGGVKIVPRIASGSINRSTHRVVVLGHEQDGPVIRPLPTDRCVHRQSDIVGVLEYGSGLKCSVGSTESNVKGSVNSIDCAEKPPVFGRR